MNTVKNEKTIWEGRPSHYINLWTYVLMGTLSPLVFPIFVILWNWLKINNTNYKLTTQRLIQTTGILSKRIEEVEFYRVRDYSIIVPLYYRWFGIATILLTTSDKTQPNVYLSGIKNAEVVRDQIRGLVEEAKKIRKVREIDIE